MTVYEFSFTLSKAPTSQCKHLIAVLPHYLLSGNNTRSDLDRAITWSWRHAFLGKWPLENHLGNPLEKVDGEHRFWRKGTPLVGHDPRYRLAMVAFKADLVFEREVFHFESYNQNNVCRMCKASKIRRNVLYTEIGEDASWRAHPRTHESYLETHADHLPHFVNIPGWHLSLHRFDLMHTLFLGVGLHLVGSVLMHLVQLGKWGGGTLRDQLRRAWLT
jgi:hypothetical protein